MIRLVNNPANDLLAPFPWGEGQNLLREALLVADHTSHHLGELIVIRRLLAAWPAEIAGLRKTKSTRPSSASISPLHRTYSAAALLGGRGHFFHHGQHQFAVAIVQVRGVAPDLRKEAHFLLVHLRCRPRRRVRGIGGKELAEWQCPWQRLFWLACREKGWCDRFPRARDSSATAQCASRYLLATSLSATGNYEWFRQYSFALVIFWLKLQRSELAA